MRGAYGAKGSHDPGAGAGLAVTARAVGLAGN
jgi:hypothetical protein